MADQWRRGGKIVRMARAERWRTVQDFADAIGLSHSVVDDIETGRRGKYAPRTVAAIEDGLSWAPGSLERVFNGGDPTPLPDPELARVMAAWPGLTIQSRRILAMLAEGALSDRGSEPPPH